MKHRLCKRCRSALTQGALPKLSSISVAENSKVSLNSVEGAPGAALTAGENVIATANRFVGNGVGVIASTGVFSGNLIANNDGAGLQVGAATVLSNTFTGNGGAAAVLITAPVQFAGNNLEGNRGPYDLYVEAPYGTAVDVRGNWWGTTNTAAIAARVFDYRWDDLKAAASFTPAAEDVNRAAPAYVRRVTVLPDSTVGIERVTFDVEFSRDLRDDETPSLVAAGAVSTALTTLRAISGTHALFDAEITSLWPRGAYSLTVVGAVGADGIEVAPNSAYAFTVVRTGLNLVRGQAYYVSAQARNAGGLWSDSGQSNEIVGGVVTVLPTATPTRTFSSYVPEPPCIHFPHAA